MDEWNRAEAGSCIQREQFIVLVERSVETPLMFS